MFMKKSIQESDNLTVLKYKIAVLNEHLYLCGFIISKEDTKNILRTCCVVSCNPAVFEIDLKNNIKTLENEIYRYKFDEGNNIKLANKIFFKLYDCEEKVVEAISKKDFGFIQEQILTELNLDKKDKIKAEYVVESLNLEVRSEINYKSIDNVVSTLDKQKFFIKTKPVIDRKKGVSVEKIKPNCEILCEFVDNRVISKNIMKILFSEKEKFLYAKVVEVNQRKKGYYEIVCCITPTIYTNFIVEQTQRLVIRK